MNENEINILLDHFVDGVDASETASIIQKIKTRPAWSDAYQKISRVFGSLSTVREQNQQQQAPTGLAHKTFQKILELENAKKVNCNYFAQKENSSVTESVQTQIHKANSGIKPSILALCVCAGFLLVVAPATWFFMGTSSVANHNAPTSMFSFAQNDSVVSSIQTQNSTCNGIEFAVTGTNQNSDSSHFFNPCSSSCSATFTNCSATNNQLTVNAPDKLVCLNNSSDGNSVSCYKPVDSKISYTDGRANFVTQLEEQPLIIVSSSTVSPDLFTEQKNPHDAQKTQGNFFVPVFYQQ